MVFYSFSNILIIRILKHLTVPKCICGWSVRKVMANSMALNTSGEAARCKATQQLPNILWYPPTFTPAFTTALHCSLSSARPIQFTITQTISLEFTSVLFTKLCFGLHNGLSPSFLHTNNPSIPPFPIRATFTAHLTILDYTISITFHEDFKSWSSSLYYTFYYIVNIQSNPIPLLTPNCRERCVASVIKTWAPIGSWIGSLRLQSLGTVPSMAQPVYLDHLQQLLPSTGSSLNSSVTNWTDSSPWCNPTARLARLLNSNSTCLWTAPRPVNCFSLFCWTPSYRSLFLWVLGSA
jgi:hypothetical protein